VLSESLKHAVNCPLEIKSAADISFQLMSLEFFGIYAQDFHIFQLRLTACKFNVLVLANTNELQESRSKYYHIRISYKAQACVHQEEITNCLKVHKNIKV